MTKIGQFRTVAAAALALAGAAGEASAAQCGDSAAGFEGWKQQFAAEARARGVSGSAVSALMDTNYASATIAADRGQRSFRLSLDQFLAKRGGSAIVSRGRALKQSQAALFAQIEQRYGVPPGPLLAIWAWRPPSAPSAAIRTSSRRLRPSPMIAGAAPISPTSSTRR